MYYSVKRQRTPGPAVQFNCPKCGGVAVSGSSYELFDTLQVFHLVPLWNTRNTYISCSHCQAEMISRLNLDELHDYCDFDLTPYMSYDVSFVFKFLAVAALLLCWTPILGLVLAIIAVAGTFRVPGWPPTLALFSTLLSLVPTTLLIVGAALNRL
jgi:hypothetical protein